MAAGMLAQIVRGDIAGRRGLGPDAPGKIVVTIDQGDGAKKLMDPGEGGVVRRSLGA
jgi:hypothetical protein